MCSGLPGWMCPILIPRFSTRSIQHTADIFRAAVHANGLRHAAPRDDAAERAYAPQGRQRKTGRNPSSSAIKIVQNVERREAAPAGELILYKIYQSYQIERTKGSINTKLHAICDSKGRPPSLFITGWPDLR